MAREPRKEAGLAYDLLLKPRVLPAALQAARAFPELWPVILHSARPEIAPGLLRPWARGMAPFAELPHVSCKLSGMVTEADWISLAPLRRTGRRLVRRGLADLQLRLAGLHVGRP